MGNQKQKWTAEEEEALLAGIAKHGPGKWKNILRDPQFSLFLTQRSNIDLKDKWRNLSVSNSGQGSKDKSKAAKVKALSVAQNVTPTSVVQQSTGSDGNANAAVVDDIASDGKAAPRYDAMIFEALSSMKDINGCDISAMIQSIEQRHEKPPNLRRALSSRLRTLVCQGKLEKVENCYRISNNMILGAKTPPPKQKNIRPQQLQNSGLTSGESVQEAAIIAACKVAEAESKSFAAAEAVREAERVFRMAEDTDAMLQLVNEIYERCSHGAIVLFA